MMGRLCVTRVVHLWLWCQCVSFTAAMENCPTDCTCTESAEEGLSIRCTLSSAVTPGTFPSRTRNLDVLFVKTDPLVDIQEGSFAHLNHIEGLTVRGEIGVIHTGAFTNISGGVTNTTRVAAKLRLWTGKILHIKKAAFQAIHRLESLEITATRIGLLEGHAFVDIANIGEVKVWGSNISYASTYTFGGLHDVKSMTLKSARFDHLSNGAFMGMKRLERFEVWNTKILCMGELAFVGMIKINTVEFSRSAFPVTPLFSWNNPACQFAEGFHCMNVSQKINMSVMNDASEQICLVQNHGNTQRDIDYARAHMTHIRYTVGFACGGMLFFILLGLYMGHRTSCNRKNKVWHHPRFGRHLGLPIAAVDLRNTGRIGRPPQTRRRPENPSRSQETPPVSINSDQHMSEQNTYADIFYTSNPDMALPPSYEECLKTAPTGPFYEVPLSPPPPYAEDLMANVETQATNPAYSEA